MNRQNIIDFVSYQQTEEGVETLRAKERCVSSDLSSAIEELILRLRERNPLPV